MKNLLFIPIIGIICLLGFYAFTGSGSEDIQALLIQSQQKNQDSSIVIASQNECIDDLESSLYDFSTENANLRTENAYLINQNESLRAELAKYATKAADLRTEMTALEIENYNTKRQLDQLIKGREIRARHQSELLIATANSAIMPSPDSDEMSAVQNEELNQIAETQTKIEEIQAALEQRNNALAKIEKSTKDAFTSIQNNEAKIQYNIDIDPLSNPTKEFTDPLVSQEVLFTESTAEQPRLFSQLEMTADENIAAIETEEDEFSSKSPVYSLIENTRIIYNYIACRNDRYGRKIKKLKNGSKNWKYTFLQFNLESENTNTLLDKQFRMRVLSTDLNTYLNFTTDKQAKSSTYFDFVYEGEPIKISFFNEKKVIGKSFDIQIFHIVDGEEYLLEDFQKTLFKEGQQATDNVNKLAPKL